MFKLSSNNRNLLDCITILLFLILFFFIVTFVSDTYVKLLLIGLGDCDMKRY